MLRSIVSVIAIVCLVNHLAAQPEPLHVIWQRSGVADTSHFGYSILALGDQNDDGYDDWAVESFGVRRHGGPYRSVEFFYGGNPTSTTPYRTIYGQIGVCELAWSDEAGDINGDGYQDWFITFYLMDTENTNRVCAFWGGPDSDTLPDWSVLALSSDAVRAVGDFNGDGYCDIGLNSYETNTYGVFWGGGSPDTLRDWILHPFPEQTYPPFPVAFGDLNGDGYSDIFADMQGDTFCIYYGSAEPDSFPAHVWYYDAGPPAVTDVNGDGYDDMIFGYGNINLGRPNLVVEPDFHIAFDCDHGYPCGVGDINRDGYNDFIYFNYLCDGEWYGKFSLYLGGAWIDSMPVMTVLGHSPTLEDLFISNARGLGDVNGDGADDFAVGGYSWAPPVIPGERGQVVIFGGDTSLHVDANDPVILHPSSFGLSVYPNPFNSTVQISFTLPVTSRVSLRLYDVLGREVKLFMDDMQTAGEHRVSFDGSGLSSGVYLCRMQAGGFEQTKKIILVR